MQKLAALIFINPAEKLGLLICLLHNCSRKSLPRGKHPGQDFERLSTFTDS